jgi:hypothetical protein
MMEFPAFLLKIQKNSFKLRFLKVDRRNKKIDEPSSQSTLLCFYLGAIPF